MVPSSTSKETKMSRLPQVDPRRRPSCAIESEYSPEYMYNFETLREDWTQACRKCGRRCQEKFKYYLNKTFDRHLKEIVFVVAYGIDHSAGIFLDFKAYKFLKDKVERAVQYGDRELPDVAPTKLSRKTPHVMRMFDSIKDFVRSTNQLRHKNDAIARQRYVNGIYLLERINKVMEQKRPLFLAFDARICRHDPKKVTQVGWIIFALETSQNFQEYYSYGRDQSLPGLKNTSQMALKDCEFSFTSIEMPSLAEALCKLLNGISEADFVVTYSMSSGGLSNFVGSQGVQFEVKETMDIVSLYSTLFHESRRENTMEEMMKKLDIPYESRRLENASYCVVYIMQIFRALLNQEFCLCLSL